MMSKWDEFILVLIYYALRYWKLWAILVPTALISLGYYLGGLS